MKSFWQFFKDYMKPDLCWAAKAGKVQQIEQLVADGHDINSHNSKIGTDDSTPLHIAARYGKAEAVRTLVRLGARINEKDREGRTPLIEAVNDSGREDVVRLFVELGANLDTRDKSLKTALDWAAFAGKAELVKLLLNGGAKPNPGRGDKRSSPVYWSIAGGNIQVLELLVSAKADVNAPGIDMSPLSSAALHGRSDFAKILLRAGADPNQADSEGFTSLMSAVAGGSLEIAEMLVKAGADPNTVRLRIRETALDMALNRKRRAIADYLRGIGAKSAGDLPPPPAAADSTIDWQLRFDALLIATVDPWPPRQGAACIKVEVTTADENTQIVKSVACRVAAAQENSEEWRRMRKTEESEDGSFHFESSAILNTGDAYIQFRVHDKMDPDPQDLMDWKVDVQ
jgi:ankyrin repeat protein